MAGPKLKWHSVVDVTGGESKDVIKNNIAWEPGMLGPWIKVCGQAGDGKIEHQHLRNQWTKMVRNRQI